MVGDGYTMPLHCETIDCPLFVEPDSGPYYCDYQDSESGLVE